MKSFKVSQEILDTMLQYLASQPYGQVYKLIEAIQKDAQLIEEPKSEESSE